MSTDKIVSELQNVNPSAVIELFTLTLDNSLHGATTTYRFHAGTSLKDNGETESLKRPELATNRQKHKKYCYY